MGVQIMYSTSALFLILVNAILFGITFPFVSSAQHCVQSQKDLLLDLKNNLIYDSSFSTKLIQWSGSIDCCRWGGVSCDSQGRVTGLDLSFEFISGGIDNNTTSLFQLEFLQNLSLAGNDFNSVQLPSKFGLLTSLRYLNLSESGFSGQIPAEFSQLTRLVVLDLSSIFMSSTVKLESPDLKRLIHNFTQLRELHLDGVNISANGYEWCNAVSSFLPNLRVLSLYNTSITGPFDPSLAKLRSLSEIYLDFNTFSSPIPDFLANFPSLRILTLFRCNLSGVVPRKLFQISSLQSISLSGNEYLEGSLPEFPVNSSLKILYLSGTKLSGTLPESIGNLKMLSDIALSSCGFSGPIPNSMFALPSLESLSLDNNQFSGSLDFTHDFRKLTNLIGLDLSNNNLSVSINPNVPVSSYLPHLKGLGLGSCNLQKFPPLQNYSSFSELDLSNNKLCGEIPNWIWELVNNGSLNYLDLSHNQFTGVLEPYDISRSNIGMLDLKSNMLSGRIPVLPSSVYYVDFSNNNFSSSLPENISSYLYLRFFYITNNNIEGTIPASLCYASEIEILDLSNNSLHGKIPSCLVPETLRVLNLRRNNLSGDIPDTFLVDCAFETLDLGWNNLTGQIPRSLSRCTELKILNFEHNNLNDSFPCFIKNWSALHILKLSSNKFHGDINCMQDDNYTWPNLQIIDLASNNFNGILPGNLFHNMKALAVDVNGRQSQLDYLHPDSRLVRDDYQYSLTLTNKGLEVILVRILITYTLIDFSNNHFQAVIPATIGELKSLYFLNFSRNALSGSIPSSVEKLHALESLDLSSNHLEGEIPQQLASLTFLSFLNVSCNKLVGRIPLGAQMSTFSASSFQGNKGLCGLQLNTSCTSIEARPRESDQEHESLDNRGIYISAELGFIVGLGILYAPLMFSRRWRRFFMKLLDKVALFILRRR